MSQTILHMAAAGTGGTQNAVSNIDVPEDGTIEGVSLTLNADLDADGENILAELSFIATNQYSTNDARGVIASAAMQFGIVTSGGNLSAVNYFVPMDLDVSGGERLYLHIVASAGVASTFVANIYFAPRGGVVRRSRRRT